MGYYTKVERSKTSRGKGLRGGETLRTTIARGRKWVIDLFGKSHKKGGCRKGCFVLRGDKFRKNGAGANKVEVDGMSLS